MTPAQQADIAARFKASREAQQARFNLALPRLGTENRAVATWIDGVEFLMPADVPAAGAGSPPCVPPAAGTH